MDFHAAAHNISPMKLPYGWIQEFIDDVADANEVARVLTSLGFAVDAITEEQGEPVFDLDLPTNRPDLLGVLGLCGELATFFGKKLKLPEAAVSGSGAEVPIEIRDPNGCPFYSGRIVKLAKNGDAPDFIQKRIQQFGLRPVNCIVDITNYVLLETGHPLHAFDAAKMSGRRIVVRRAAAGEKITAIDGKDYSLSPADLVIADADVPQAIAGVMGGKASEISFGTRELILESAVFETGTIRVTSRRLQLPSFSSYRFERGTFTGRALLASRRAAFLFEKYCGATAEKECNAGTLDRTTKAISLPATEYRRLTGVDLDVGTARRILMHQGFTLDDSAETCATPPTTRRDVSASEDLVEEIARHIGYDKFDPDINARILPVITTKRRKAFDDIDACLNEVGFHKAVSWTFEEEDWENSFDEYSTLPSISIKARSAQVSYRFRKSLIPSFLKLLRISDHSHETPVPLFDVGSIAVPSADGFVEKRILGIFAAGKFGQVRGAVEALAKRGCLDLSFVVKEVGVFEPGKSLEIVVDGAPIGQIGMVDGLLLRRLDISCRDVAVAELSLEALAAKWSPRGRYAGHEEEVSFDIAIAIKEEIRWEEVDKTVANCGGEVVVEAFPFDIFRGDKLGKGVKSIAFRVVVKKSAQENIVELRSNIVKGLSEKLGAVVR